VLTAGADARPARILMVSANYRPSVGGIERFVEILAEGLAAAGDEVTVLCCRYGRSAPLEHANGVRIVRLPSTYAPKRLWNVPYPLPEPVALARELRRLVGSADVVHAHDALYVTSVAALAAARALRVPAVLTQHVAFVPQSSRLLDAIERLAIATLGRCARLASHVVAYNPAVAAWAEETWRVPPVGVVSPGVPEAPQVDRPTLRRELGLPEDRLVALFVGRDVPKKGLDVFVAARDPAYELVAVTDRVSPLPPEGVRLLPFMEPERLREVLCAVDAFVLPSEAEGFPLSLQEALVTGLPCVVVRGPGYEHYLRAGESLFVRREADDIRGALRRLAADEPFRRLLASRAREAGRREFGLERFVQAYRSLYRSTVAGR
jgi:D-inositol-3-phosphate glycosyltransferase